LWRSFEEAEKNSIVERPANASIVVDGLIESSVAGDDARELRRRSGLFVPRLLYAEVIDALRKVEARKNLSLERKLT
jgi:hypothetical protein